MSKKKADLQVKRVYEPAEDADGLRVLVDRLWPRGISKESGRVDLWLRDIAPSNELRKRFHGHPEDWAAFRAAYAKELAAPGAAQAIEALRARMAEGRVTLLYAARDETHNNAAALKAWLEKG